MSAAAAAGSRDKFLHQATDRGESSIGITSHLAPEMKTVVWLLRLMMQNRKAKSHTRHLLRLFFSVQLVQLILSLNTCLGYSGWILALVMVLLLPKASWLNLFADQLYWKMTSIWFIFFIPLFSTQGEENGRLSLHAFKDYMKYSWYKCLCVHAGTATHAVSWRWIMCIVCSQLLFLK